MQAPKYVQQMRYASQPDIGGSLSSRGCVHALSKGLPGRLTPIAATDFIAPPASVPSLTRSSENRAFVTSLCTIANELGVWINVGVHEPPPPEETTRCFNTQLLIDDKGQIQARYRKVCVHGDVHAPI